MPNKKNFSIGSKNKWIKPVVVAVIALTLIGGAISFKINDAKAEQSGQSPNSGAGVTSRIKTLYDEVVALNFGSDTDTPDWGALWNRIKTAAKWTPTVTTTATDVRSGKTFIATGTRSNTTGAYPAPGPCPTEAYHDNYGAPVTQTTNCTNDITFTTNPTPAAGDDTTGYDPRTGLTWSQLIYNNAGTPTFSPTTNSAFTWDGSTTFTVTAAAATAGATYTNNGATFTVVTTIAGTTTLVTTGTAIPTTSGTLTKATGTGDATITYSAVVNGINNAAVGAKTAKQICTAMGGGWRLPTQKELMQVYIDGSFFKLTQPSNNFWSATEGSATSAWYVALSNGNAGYANKSTSSSQVRCVR